MTKTENWNWNWNWSWNGSGSGSENDDETGVDADADDSSTAVRCAEPAELRGRPFLQMDASAFCARPLRVTVAVRDIRSASVNVSWQAADHSHPSAYKIVYRAVSSAPHPNGLEQQEQQEQQQQQQQPPPPDDYDVSVAYSRSYAIRGGRKISGSVAPPVPIPKYTYSITILYTEDIIMCTVFELH